MPAFNDVQIVDFKAIPSKVTYVLSTGNKGYFVQNRDSNQKDFDGNSKERRVTLGRLTHGWNFGSKGTGLQFKGMGHSGPDELFEVEGELLKNKNRYAIVNEVPTDITPTEMTKLFAKPLLQQLEHYMVPDDMANNIRKHKITSVPSKEQASPKTINYGKIKVENLMKRPDRMIYVLVDTTDQTKTNKQPNFVIINNDSDMDESWRLQHNWKSEIEHQKTRRHITVARLIDKEDEKNMNLCAGLQGSGSLFKGFAYPTSLYGEDGGDRLSKKIKEEIGEKEFSKRFPELYAGAGRIESSYCYKSESEKNTTYTTMNEMPIEENPSDTAKLLTPALLQQLERFTVPHEMAVQIREHAKP
jgi:hypothetical protein